MSHFFAVVLRVERSQFDVMYSMYSSFTSFDAVCHHHHLTSPLPPKRNKQDKNKLKS
jgi:hypothetical protein